MGKDEEKKLLLLAMKANKANMIEALSKIVQARDWTGMTKIINAAKSLNLDQDTKTLFSNIGDIIVKYRPPAAQFDWQEIIKALVGGGITFGASNLIKNNVDTKANMPKKNKFLDKLEQAGTNALDATEHAVNGPVRLVNKAIGLTAKAPTMSILTGVASEMIADATKIAGSILNAGYNDITKSLLSKTERRELQRIKETDDVLEFNEKAKTMSKANDEATKARMKDIQNLNFYDEVKASVDTGDYDAVQETLTRGPVMEAEVSNPQDPPEFGSTTQETYRTAGPSTALPPPTDPDPNPEVETNQTIPENPRDQIPVEPTEPIPLPPSTRPPLDIPSTGREYSIDLTRLDPSREHDRSIVESAWAGLYNVVGGGAATAAGLYLGSVLGPQAAGFGAYSAYNMWGQYKNEYMPSTSGQREAFSLTDSISDQLHGHIARGHRAPGAAPMAAINPLSVQDVGTRISDAAINILSGNSAQSHNQVGLIAKDFQSYVQRISLPYAI